MKTKFFVLSMLILALAVGLSFVGCEPDNDLISVGGNDNPSNPSAGDPSLPGPGTQVSQGSGWPSSGKLSEYTIVGWNQPAGLGGITWTETKITETYFSLNITFTDATAATQNSIDDFLAFWATETNPISDGQTVSVTYVKRGGILRYGIIVYYELSTGGYIIIDRVSEDEIDPLL